MPRNIDTPTTPHNSRKTPGGRPITGLGLTRHAGEAVLITVKGVEVRVIVSELDTRNRRAKLVISAPPDAVILREELLSPVTPSRKEAGSAHT